MFNRKLYHEACRELRAPEEKIEEIISMTKENNRKRRRPIRTLLVAVAAIAMMAVGVSAANPEVLEVIVTQIATVLQVGELRQDMTTADGLSLTALEIPVARVENQNGKAILQVMGEEIDITDALSRHGEYSYSYADEGAELSILVEGSPEDWTMTTSVNAPGEESGVSLVVTKEEQDAGGAEARYATKGEDQNGQAEKKPSAVAAAGLNGDEEVSLTGN